MKQIAALVLFAAACSGQLLYGAAPYAGLPFAGLPYAGYAGLPHAAGIGYSGLPLTYTAATTGLPLTYTAATTGLPLTYTAAGTTAIAPAGPALRDAELEKIVNNPGHATSYRIRPDIPEASRKRRDLTAISALPYTGLPYTGLTGLPYAGLTGLPYAGLTGLPYAAGIGYSGLPLNYAATSGLPLTYTAATTGLPLTYTGATTGLPLTYAAAAPAAPALRDAELEKIVNNPGHATSYRVRPDIA
ncbi:uncharacterized protein LOC143032149 [Oratosquilla oratoria]|uniref:uncharacterized protein LOC143032149 n=1 Tax=Oratosquilla oratoria TaxID=337810 RepID=UPI003F757609